MYRSQNKLKLYSWPILSILLLYVGIRVLAWKFNILLEDHDSVSYLRHTVDILNLNWQHISDWSPDSTPFYPFIAALFSLPGWSAEFGARLASLSLSIGLFFALIGIGNRLSEKKATMVGLIILSLSPVLVSLSFSVLTEPSYIALVYLGLLLLLMHSKELKIWPAALAGLVFGLAFLNRTEGIVFLVGAPFFLGILSLWSDRSKQRIMAYLKWCTVFVVFFTILAGPQIWNVSQKMNRFAINGRQVWMQILNSADGKTYQEKIYGLSYSKKDTNLIYAQKNLDTNQDLVKKNSLTDVLNHIKNIMINLLLLYQSKLGLLIGPIGFVLFGLGLLYLYQSGKRSEIVLIFSFLLLNLIPPLAHNVATRHIAIIAPLIILMEGIGFMYLLDIASKSAQRHIGFIITVVLAMIVHLGVGSGLTLMRNVSNSQSYNYEYQPKVIEKVTKIIENVSTEKTKKNINIAARKAYLAYYFSGEKNIALPYTSYNQLVEWCCLNNIDFIFLQHRLLKEYPFLKSFKSDMYSKDFSLIYKDTDHWGKNIELYRFNNKFSYIN